MKIKIPDTFMGKPIEGAMESILKLPPKDIDSPENYILLPGGKYGNHDFPDMFIGFNRLGYSLEAEQIAQRNGWTLTHTAKEYDGQGPEFIGNVNYTEAIKLNEELGNVTLSLLLHKEFLKTIHEGSNRRAVYDGAGNLIAKDRLVKLFNEITEVRDPYRAEWSDAQFTEKSKQMQITYPIFQNGKWERITEDLEEHLREDKKIDLAYWLNNATSQGLPPKNCPDGNFNYWYPRDGCVGGFRAGSDRANLVCFRNPSGRNGALGVRAARAKI